MKTKASLLFLTLILFACARNIPQHQILSSQTPTPLAVITASPHIVTIVPTPIPLSTFTFTTTTAIQTLLPLENSIIDIPKVTLTFDAQCGGMYDSELFFLSQTIDNAVKTLDSKAEGWAKGIGQNCKAKDNKPYFYSFGIWFYIDKPVANLGDFKEFGSWIVSVMNLLDKIPRDEFTIGAEPTVVNFRFYVQSESLDVRVPIQKYHSETNKKNETEIFLLFYSNP